MNYYYSVNWRLLCTFVDDIWIVSWSIEIKAALRPQTIWTCTDFQVAVVTMVTFT